MQPRRTGESGGDSRGLRRTSRDIDIDIEIGCRIEEEGSEELLKQPGVSFAIVSPRLAELMVVVLSRERCKFAALDRRCQRELANGDDVGSVRCSARRTPARVWGRSAPRDPMGRSGRHRSSPSRVDRQVVLAAAGNRFSTSEIATMSRSKDAVQ